MGIDPGAVVPPQFTHPFVRFVSAPAASQASALNSAASVFDHDLIAFLEDDDLWSEQFLEVALPALDQAPFVSSTQLEVDGVGEVICINDFPTPSGWIMRRDVWTAVGPFDESYRFHLDNDWLGRLGEFGLPAAPPRGIDGPASPAGVEDAAAAAASGAGVSAAERPSWPATSTPCPWSAAWFISAPAWLISRPTPKSGAASNAEHARLVERFGRIPW